LEIKSYSPHQIDAIISKQQSSNIWRFTGFYGHLENPHEKGILEPSLLLK